MAMTMRRPMYNGRAPRGTPAPPAKSGKFALAQAVERRRDAGAGQRALAQDGPGAVGLERAQVDDGRGGAVELTAVEHEVDRVADARLDVGHAPGVGAAGRVGRG